MFASAAALSQPRLLTVVLFVASLGCPRITSAVCFLDQSPGFTLPLVYDDVGQVTCLRGFHCPLFDASNRSTYPVYCPPTPECQITRLQGKLCDTPMGTTEPVLCPKGFYCPNATAVVQCPTGYFCPVGQYQPLPCPPLSQCPAGSAGPRSFQSIVALAVVLCIVAAVFQLYHRRLVLCWLPLKYSCDAPKVSRLPSNSLPSASEPTSEDVLAHYFSKSRGDLKPLTLQFRDLSVELLNQDGRRLLASVSGALRPGTVTAVLGPSGCGKTVLLKALVGRTEMGWKVHGQLSINGESGVSSKYRSMIGFVPQDDVLHTELTAFRNVMYSGELRLPQEWRDAERADLIKAVLEALGIAHVVDVAIGTPESRGVSGGQRKRVSIGVELVSAPLALFLDEPTKGLDSNTALEVCSTLKQIAVETSLTVAMVVNQPRTEIWNALDELLVLGPGGRTVYQGSRAHITTFFAKQFGVDFPADCNPADVILDFVTKRGSELADLWEIRTPNSWVGDGDHYTNATEEVINGDADSVHSWRGLSVFGQVRLAHMLYLEKQLCNVGTFLVEVLVSAVLGILLGYSLSQNDLLGYFVAPYDRVSVFPEATLSPQMQMFAMMSLGLATSTAGVNVFVNDKGTCARMLSGGGSAVAFYIGTVSASWYRLFPVTLAFAAPYHVLAGIGAPFEKMFGILFLFSFNMYALAGIVALLTDRRSAPLIAGVGTIVYACFSGFITFPTTMKKLSVCFWVAQSLHEWTFEPMAHVFGDTMTEWGWTQGQTNISFLVVAAMGVAYHVMACILLVVQFR